MPNNRFYSKSTYLLFSFVALLSAFSHTVWGQTPTTLELVKAVLNDDGGTNTATDWILSADGPTPGLSGAGGFAATDVLPGTYILSETAGPAGYTPGGMGLYGWYPYH